MKEEERWELRCSEKKFEELRNNERFWSILTLARALNELRFSQVAYFGPQEDDTPASRRQRINSFVFTGAILYEALGFAQTLGKYFQHLAAFKDGLARLFEDKTVRDFRDTTLHRLRNKFVFHFDDEVPTQALRGFRKPPYIFNSGQGPRIGNAYYDLADSASLYFLLMEKNDDQLSAEELERAVEERFRDLARKMSNLSGRFGAAADELIAAGLKELDPDARLHPSK